VGSQTNALFVDWGNGHDGNTGTIGSPLKTVAFALEQSILASAAPRPIVLRNGTHPLRNTLEIGPELSGLHLTAFAGEQATLSGGVHLSLEFSSSVINGVRALVATLPPTVPDQAYTELFVADGNSNALNLNDLSRYTKQVHKQSFLAQSSAGISWIYFDRLLYRARWPDGDPETGSGLCTTTNGCKAYSKAVGSCGSVPFVNGTWVEIGPVSTQAIILGSIKRRNVLDIYCLC